MRRAWRGLVWLAAVPLLAHDPITTKLTWSQEISRVVYRHCASCHRSGGRAFPLVTYEDARPWAKAIRDEVLNRRMPPWDAVKGVGEFRDDPSLSLPEMDLVVNWVEGGAPEGDPAYLPAAPPELRAAIAEAAAGLELRESLTLRSPYTLAAIRPAGPLELAVLFPDGAVQRLLWVRTFRPEWNRDYRLRTPLHLPKGTRIVLTGAPARLIPGKLSVNRLINSHF